jgi:hypothetical protein
MASKDDGTRKPVPAKKAVASGKAAPPKRKPPGKQPPAADVPENVQGELTFDDKGRLCLLVQGKKIPVERFANKGNAELTLVVKLKRRDAPQVSADTAKLMEILRQFLEKRTQGAIAGGVTTCRKPPGAADGRWPPEAICDPRARRLNRWVPQGEITWRKNLNLQRRPRRRPRRLPRPRP